ncbi:hypothetical protein ABS768_08685 [Flavobacterium sp. ST-75]|uniref:Uncharacterized protein n=1 Tax=Flavobacterium rhizophilum TaxID=3163296 RepID=A0ABW8YE49_9FLAO
MKAQLLHGEDSNSSRRMQGKRSLANYEACKHDLGKELGLLFSTYHSALAETQTLLLGFPPEYRSKALEAGIMQSNFAKYLHANFNERTFYGKYKRLILRTDGYLILFKKLDGKGYPMNIKTQNVQSILSQQQTLDLFAESNYNDEPILYFGYQKDKLNAYVNPQLIYIDEGEIKFSITEKDLGNDLYREDKNIVTPPAGPQPTLKNVIPIKKVQ